MRQFSHTLDEKLSPNMLMRERFDRCDQVLAIMVRLQQEFPYLMFPDIKPKNFLCLQQTGNAELVVLTDLDDVRRTGTVVSTHTAPYRHEAWKDGPSKKFFEQYAVAVTLLQILLGMRSKVDAWEPRQYVELFSTRPAAEDQLLQVLRDHDPGFIKLLRGFFIGPAGYLSMPVPEDDVVKYEQMKDTMLKLSARAKELDKAAATSVGGLAGVQRPAQAPVHVWQTSLRSKITSWERQLANHQLKTFHGSFQQGGDELQRCLTSLKRAVGSPEEPGTCSRTDYGQLPPRQGPGSEWPNKAIIELQTERDEKNRGNRRLDGFYHTELPASPAWHVQGKTNIQRLVDNLSTLRRDTNEAHHLASLSDVERENICSRENIDRLMGRLSLLFQKGSPKDPEEPRMLF